MDLNKEAEEYVKNLFGKDLEQPFKAEIYDAYSDFIAGANSKYVQAKIIQAQMDILKRTSSERWTDIFEELQQQLKQLENE